MRVSLEGPLQRTEWFFIFPAKINMDKYKTIMLIKKFVSQATNYSGGDLLGSVIKKRRKKMRRHKHKKLLARTRHQRRKGK